MTNTLKDIQDYVNAFLSELPENIKKQKIKTLPFCKDLNNYTLSIRENCEFHIKKENSNFYYSFKTTTPKQKKIRISFSNCLKNNKKTTIEDILKKIEKIINFQNKNEHKKDTNFSKSLIAYLIKTKKLTPEIQKALIRTSYFKIIKGSEIFTISGHEKDKTKTITIKTKNSLFQRFYRNQFIKIKGKPYYLQNDKSFKESHVIIKENKPKKANFIMLNNTIRDFHTLSHFIKNNHKSFQH